MATLTQYPDALSFSRNLKEVKISSTAEVRFQLKKNSSVLLDERYQPDTSGQVSIDIRDVVTASLSLTIPTEDAFEQTNAVASFSIHLDGSSTAAATFVAVLGGISGAAEQASTFLPANFLTWQTQEKMVTADQPEWLTYYFKGAYTVKAKYYYEDGTDNAVDIFTGSEGKVYSIDCNFSRLTALGTVTGKKMFGVIDVYVVDTNGLVLTYVQRYCYRAAASLDKIFLCQNSIGGIDTFLFSGESKFIPELEHTVSSYDDRLVPAVTDAKRRYLQNTGVLTSDAELNLWELFSSLNAYCLRDGQIRRIVLDTSTIEESNIETAGSWSFEYRISDDDGLLNVSRNSGFRPVPPIPCPTILLVEGPSNINSALTDYVYAITFNITTYSITNIHIICEDSDITIREVHDSSFKLRYNHTYNTYEKDVTIYVSCLVDGVLLSRKKKIHIESIIGTGIQHKDGNIYTKSEWIAKGFDNEEARGVAVVDASSAPNGLCIFKDESNSWLEYSRPGIDVSSYGVTMANTFAQAMADMAGKTNTDGLIAAYKAGALNSADQVEYARGFGDEWYIPSFGESLVIPDNIATIVDLVRAIGGTLFDLFETLGYSDFPTSTQKTATISWWMRASDHSFQPSSYSKDVATPNVVIVAPLTINK